MLLFLVTPCHAVAVHPSMEWIPIKKKALCPFFFVSRKWDLKWNILKTLNSLKSIQMDWKLFLWEKFREKNKFFVWKKKTMVSFYGRGSTVSRLVPLRAGSFLFTTKRWIPQNWLLLMNIRLLLMGIRLSLTGIYRKRNISIFKRESKTPTYFKILWLKAFYTWEMAAKYVKE